MKDEKELVEQREGGTHGQQVVSRKKEVDLDSEEKEVQRTQGRSA